MTTPWQRVFPDDKPLTADDWLAARSRFDEELRLAGLEGFDTGVKEALRYARKMKPQNGDSLSPDPAGPCEQSGAGTFILKF